jgi:hypothetical protein
MRSTCQTMAPDLTIATRQAQRAPFTRRYQSSSMDPRRTGPLPASMSKALRNSRGVGIQPSDDLALVHPTASRSSMSLGLENAS